MCMYCQLEEHGLCEQPARLEPAGNGLFYFACCCSASTNSDTRNEATVGTVGKGVIGRPPKDASDMEDVISTGRHRAARALPNIEGTPCHWRGLLYAGGGAVPIIGCLSGDASDRHHGPDKSVINNAVGVNLHALCDTCLRGDMRLLTEDLRWVKAEDIKVGDRLIGFSEELKNGVTVYEPAVVTSAKKVLEPSYEITMTNGDVLVVSHAHLFPANRPGDRHINWYSADQIAGKGLGPGPRTSNHFALKKLLDVYEPERTYEAGWFSGFLDGEGSLSQHALGAAQADDGDNIGTCDKMFDAFDKYAPGYRQDIRKASARTKDVWVLRVSSQRKILELLTRVRPERLIAKVPSYLYEKRGPLSSSMRIEVASIKYVGEIEVYAIETTSKTYIVEGYLSHNCHARWHVLNDPLYPNERPPEGKPFIPLSGEVIPHDSKTLATQAQIIASDMWWAMPIELRTSYESLRETENN